MSRDQQHDVLDVPQSRRDGAASDASPAQQDAKAARASDAGQDALERQAVTGAGWAGLSFGVRQIVMIGCTLALTRPLDKADYGLAAIMLLVASFVDIVQDFGTASALVRSESVSRRMISSTFWLNTCIGVVATAVVAGCAPLLTLFPSATLKDPKLITLLQVSSLMFVISSLTIVPRAQLQRELRFRDLARAELLAAIAGTGVAVCVAYSGGGVWALLCQPMVAAVVLLAVVWSRTTWRPRFEYDHAEIRGIRSYGSYLTGYRLIDFFHMQGDYLLIGVVLGKEQLGLYYLAFRISVFPATAASSAISRVLFPFLARARHDAGHVRKSILSVLCCLGLFVYPVIFGLAAIADVFVETVCGPKWEGMALLILILLPIALSRTIATATGTLYQAYGRTDKMFFWGLYYNGIVFLSYYIGLRWGVVGVASAYSLTVLLSYPVFSVPMSLVGVSVLDMLRILRKPVAMCLVMGAVVLATKSLFDTRGGSWSCLMTMICVGMLTYGAIAWTFARGELESLWNRVFPRQHLPGDGGSRT